MRGFHVADLEHLFAHDLSAVLDVLHGLADPRAGRFVAAHRLENVVGDFLNQLPEFLVLLHGVLRAGHERRATRQRTSLTQAALHRIAADRREPERSDNPGF